MKTYRRATVSMAAVLIASCATNIWAQPTSRGSSSGMYVALLDLGYIFKNHPRFKQKMDIMKKDVQTFEQQIKQKQQQLQADGRRLSSYKPGTPEYKQIEETTTKQLADVKVRMQLKRKEIMEREAQIYMETYKEVVNAVASFARRKNIDLVLRYDSDTSAANTSEVSYWPAWHWPLLNSSDKVRAQRRVSGHATDARPTSKPSTALRTARS